MLKNDNRKMWKSLFLRLNRYASRRAWNSVCPVETLQLLVHADGISPEPRLQWLLWRRKPWGRCVWLRINFGHCIQIHFTVTRFSWPHEVAAHHSTCHSLCGSDSCSSSKPKRLSECWPRWAALKSKLFKSSSLHCAPVWGGGHAPSLPDHLKFEGR